ncbi:MAG: response regulator [Actinobacteria bacterium ATB1]|nr:response regulator [Actinobacteria bacterium ATB1]
MTAEPHETRVLIAEDEAIIRLDLREMLEEEGYDVAAEVDNGDDAVRLANELRPDLTILDIKMPGTDGLTAAREIVSHRWSAVLILTAFSQRELVKTAREAGAYAYVVKPFQKADLVPAIEVALGRFTEVQSLESEIEDLNERLESRKVIDRAKGKLMDVEGVSETEAFRRIQQEAMRSRLSMRKVAERIISE